MYVKPSNNYKFNKPLFKSEYSNITKSMNIIIDFSSLQTDYEVVIPICESTSIQGVRKFKNTTLQLYPEINVSANDRYESSSNSLIPVPYFLIAAEKSHITNDNGHDVFVLTEKKDFFISTNYKDLNSISGEVLNKGTLLLQGLFFSKKALIQSTRLSKNLDSEDCVYLVLKIPKDDIYTYFWIRMLQGTVNYSIKYS